MPTDFFFRAVRNAQTDQVTLPSNELFVWTSYYNDLQVDSNGNIAQVTGTDKLAQDIVKILVTQRGSNINMPLYGTNLPSIVGQKMDFQFLQGQILTEVTDALIILQSLLQYGSNPDEQISSLQSIKVTLDTPTQVSIELVVITLSQKALGLIVTI